MTTPPPNPRFRFLSRQQFRKLALPEKVEYLSQASEILREQTASLKKMLSKRKTPIEEEPGN